MHTNCHWALVSLRATAHRTLRTLTASNNDKVSIILIFGRKSLTFILIYKQQKMDDGKEA
jgi:hypothetical protein